MVDPSLTKIKKKFTEIPEEESQKADLEGVTKPKEGWKRKRLKKHKFIIPKEDKEKIPLTNEQKLYYIKLMMGFATGLIGRLIGLIGWWMLLWLMCFWWVAPLAIGYLMAPYVRDKWDWKMFEKTAVGAFFFLFMVIATIVHTLLFLAANPGWTS